MFPLSGSILNPVPVPIDNKRNGGAGGPVEDTTYWLEDSESVFLEDSEGQQLIDSEG